MTTRYGWILTMVAVAAGLLASCQDTPPTSAAKVGGDDSTVVGTCGDDIAGLPAPPDMTERPAWTGDAWVAIYLRAPEGATAKFPVYYTDNMTPFDNMTPNHWRIYQFTGGMATALTVKEPGTAREWQRAFRPSDSCIVSHLVFDVR